MDGVTVVYTVPTIGESTRVCSKYSIDLRRGKSQFDRDRTTLVRDRTTFGLYIFISYFNIQHTNKLLIQIIG